MRSLVERSATLLYLHHNPDKIDIWKRGWKYNERPSLAKILKSFGGSEFPGVEYEITQLLNSMTHGDPDSAAWSLVQMENGELGYGASKIIDNPVLCDKVCMDTGVWLAILLAMMTAIFSIEK